jgi:phage baseplate assembly protein W
VASFSYTTVLPSLPTATRPAFRARALLYGRDLYWAGGLVRSENADWLTVEGVEALRQSFLRELCTTPGEWRTRPDYGIGALALVYEEMTDSRILTLKTRIRSRFAQDPRVSRVTATEITRDDSQGLLVITVSIEARGQAITFRPFVLPDEGPRLSPF